MISVSPKKERVVIVVRAGWGGAGGRVDRRTKDRLRDKGCGETEQKMREERKQLYDARTLFLQSLKHDATVLQTWFCLVSPLQYVNQDSSSATTKVI